MAGFYCLFTDKRFFRRDFRGRKIVLRSPEDLLFFVNMHCFDATTCVHRLDAERPDWLVLDIDPGPKVAWQQTKRCTAAAYSVMEKLGLNPALKFSGGHGFQIWSLIRPFALPASYKPLTLRGEGKRERNYFSFFADSVRIIQRQVDMKLPGLTTSDPSAKAGREGKILIDPSTMKPMGLVRPPYCVHSKTGLVSLPLQPRELAGFEPQMASTERALERYKKRGDEFVLKPADPRKLIALLAQ
jgi:bifunctional non-homologous end joining protein LigD